MAVDIYKRYRDLADNQGVRRGTRDSIEWFRKTIRKQSNIGNFDTATSGLKKRVQFTEGSLATFVYDPKHKDKLPFFDVFPLIIVMKIERKHIYGCNLHYLPPKLRAELLADLNIKSKSAAQIALAMENNPISKMCLKKYIPSRIGNPYVIPKAEWEIAIQLPYENFRGADTTSVWRSIK